MKQGCIFRALLTPSFPGRRRCRQSSQHKTAQCPEDRRYGPLRALCWYVFCFRYSPYGLPSLHKRRRRDLNPRAGATDLLVFEARPFSHLGTPPKKYQLLHYTLKSVFCVVVGVNFLDIFANSKAVFHTASNSL